MPFVLRIGPSQNSQLAAVGNLLPTPITNVSATSTVAGQINLTWTGGVGNNVKYTYSVYNNTGSVLVSPTAYTISGTNPSTIAFTDNTSRSYTVTITANVLDGNTNRVSNAVVAASSYKSPSVTSGLVLHSDFSNPSTYSGTGATFYNLVNSTAQSIVTNASSYSYSNNSLVLTKGSYIQLESYTFQTVSLWFTPDTVGGAYVFDARSFLTDTYLYFNSSTVWRGSNMSVYFNGGATALVNGAVCLIPGQINNLTFVLPSAFTGALSTFCRYTLNETYVGSVSRILVYNRALTTTENTSNYNELLLLQMPTPTQWFKFNSGDIVGTTIYNYATSTYNGTVGLSTGNGGTITTSIKTGSCTGSFNYNPATKTTTAAYPYFPSFTPSEIGCTFSVWMYAVSLGQSFGQAFQLSNSYTNLISIQLGSNTTIYVNIGAGVIGTAVTVPSLASVWSHFVISLLPTGYFVYLNGSGIAAFSPSATDYSTNIYNIARSNVQLGRTAQNGLTYDSINFCDFRAYNVPLTTQQVFTLYTNGAGV